MLKRLAKYNLFKKDKNSPGIKYPIDFSEEDIELIESVKEFTMTSIERMKTLIDSVKYLIKNKIEGDIVECGVWKGGSMMLIAKTLMSLNAADRTLYLYDTFEGMTEPTEMDKDYKNTHAKNLLEEASDNKESFILAYSDLNTVKNNIYGTGYNKSLINFIEGKVEDTIPKTIPGKIAMLRLDTDWYESTYHELIHLYPKLVKNGILIIDDYGYWQGARKAVDQYFEENNIRSYLHRIDDTGRILIKS